MAENKQYDRVKEITDQLEAGIKNLFNSDQYKQWLITMSRFHDYSLNNTLLIAMQKPDATLVAGYTTWKNQFGRQVNKGEKGIRILAPTPYKQKIEVDKTDPNTGEILMNPDGSHQKEIREVLCPAFKVVSVFDVSQTDGKELPSLGVNELKGDVEQYEMFFEALKRTCPVSMEFEKISSGAKGYYHHVEKRIAILEGMSQIQTVKTAIHEMAHQKLHAIVPEQNTSNYNLENISRGGKEVEAESVAYTVCQHYGIDTSDYSFAYIASWSQGKEIPELKTSLNTIRRAASEMINDIDGHVKELRLENVLASDIKNIKCISEKYESHMHTVEYQFRAELFDKPIKLTLMVYQHDDGKNFTIHFDENDIRDKLPESELRKLEFILNNEVAYYGWKKQIERAESLDAVRNVRYGLMETENIGLSKEQYGNLWNAIDEKEILLTKEAAYCIGDNYLEVHEASDGSWDFTLYGANCKEIDGGQLSNSENISITDAVKEIAAYYQLTDRSIDLFNRDHLMAMVGLYNPELSDEQMHFIGKVICQGCDPKKYWVGSKAIDLTAQRLSAEEVADIQYQIKNDSIPKPFFTVEQWHEIEAGTAEKIDVTIYAESAFSLEQVSLPHGALNVEYQGYLNREGVLSVVTPAKSADEIRRELVSGEHVRELSSEKKKETPISRKSSQKKSLLANLHEKQAIINGKRLEGQNKSKQKEME